MELRQSGRRTGEIDAARVHDAKHTEQILNIELTDQRHFDWNCVPVELDFEREAVRSSADRAAGYPMRDFRVAGVGSAVTDDVDAAFGQSGYQATARLRRRD